MINLLIEELYTTYKPLLFSLAYRMLGMVADAEDIVHDVFLASKRIDHRQITNMKAYLCKMTTNLCIDRLKSTAKQREVYLGPWLPEPLVMDDHNEPLKQALQGDSVSFAMLMLLDKLNPVERAVFILREAFDYDYSDIAGVLDKTEANCRKLLSRAKQKIEPDQSFSTLHVKQSMILAEQFLNAARTGNLDDLIVMLTADVVLYSDGGGKVVAAIRPIITDKHVAQFLMGVARKLPHDILIKPKMINGQTGLLFVSNDKPYATISYAIDGLQIKKLFITLNPDKLKHIR